MENALECEVFLTGVFVVEKKARMDSSKIGILLERCSVLQDEICQLGLFNILRHAEHATGHGAIFNTSL